MIDDYLLTHLRRKKNVGTLLFRKRKSVVSIRGDDLHCQHAEACNHTQYHDGRWAIRRSALVHHHQEKSADRLSPARLSIISHD